jgi:hypothetical protein
MPAGSGDARAEDYERGRLGWVAVRGCGRPGLPAGATVLDLGAGRAVAGAVHGSPFEELRDAWFRHAETTAREGIVAFFASMGWVGDLWDGERLPLLDQVRSLLPGSEYCRPWEARVHSARLAPG